MKLSIIITLLLLSTSIFAQKSKMNKKNKNQTASVTTTSNWEGTYFGITDCANCDGIETKLILQKGNIYILTTKAINTIQDTFIKKGSFKWDNDIIILQGIDSATANMYKVEKNQVRQLYLIDNKIQGENWTGYILKKQ
jgi:hypothetical protein